MTSTNQNFLRRWDELLPRVHVRSACFDPVVDCHHSAGEGVVVRKLELKALSKKHQKFVDEYLQTFNGTQAYLRVYPNAKTDSARSSASELLTKDNIAAEISKRLDEVQMSADEALKLLADMARGDVGEFLNDFGGVDMTEVRKRGLTKLIKKWKVKTVTINGKEEDREVHTEEVELYDAQAALEKILKVHGKFTDRVDVTSDGKALQPAIINVYLPDNGRDKTAT